MGTQTMILPSLDAIEAAANIIHKIIQPTPQIRWPLLNERTGAEVWVKHENHTPVGAFKLRGGVVYMEELKRREPNINGVIAATRGNHGQSIAFSAGRLGLRTVIVVPRGNSKEKNAAMRGQGAELIEHGNDFQDALEHAAQLAKMQRLHFVPSFDLALVRGVATCALELFRALPLLDAVYVPIGLGTGICGTIAVRDALGLKTEIIGVTASAAPAYALSFVAGKPVSADVAATIADGMACRVPDPMAVEIIRAGVSRIVTVEEFEIRDAMRYLFMDTHNVAEGAGAAPLAALLKEKDRMRDRRVALIQTGGNVDSDVLAEVLSEKNAGPVSH
jgi:threonine dehydratase